MPSPEIKKAILASLAGVGIELDVNLFSWQSVSGGSVNQSYCVRSNSESFFVKINSADKAAMFAAEADGLNAIAATQILRVPQVYVWGCNHQCSWLVLSYLDLHAHDASSQAMFGEQLAALHQVPQAQLGWHRDNTIGLTPQLNTPSLDWVGFYAQQRLVFQLDLAKKHGFTGSIQDKGEQLIASLPLFFETYKPKPSLLHGDLWGGNHGVDAAGNPVVYDPAVYCGDREADIAMTELFGGCSSDFYAAYQACYPLDEGYTIRKPLYQLYHILNHANLFGGGYAAQAEQMMDTLLLSA